MKFWLILFVLAAGLAQASAEERVGQLRVTYQKVPVTGEAFETWTQDLFGHDEIWLFSSPTAFLKKLSQAGIDPELLQSLAGRVHNGLRDKSLDVSTFFPSLSRESFSYIFLPPRLKEKIPAPVLRAVYAELLRTRYAYPHKRFASSSAAAHYFAESPELVGHVYAIDDAFYFFYTPDLWSKLSPELKSAYFNDHLLIDSLNITLTVGAGDDLNQIANQYAGTRDPRILLRYLQTLTRGGGTVAIPLVNLLQPFIRQNVNTYASCSGPNCFNAAVSVNDGNFYEIQTVANGARLLRQLSERRFRYLMPKEPLQTGDVLLYEAENGRIEHASTYVTEQIIFEKSGYSKFSPYAFNYRRDSEDSYFPDGRFRLMALRPDKAALQPTPLLQGKIYYRELEPQSAVEVCRRVLMRGRRHLQRQWATL